MPLSRNLAILAALATAGPGLSAAQDAPWKPFAEVTQGADAATGIFSVYFKRDQVLLSLTAEHFDRDYLLVAQLSQGIGELGLDGGTSVRSDLIRFHRQGDRVELWVINPHFAATPGSPMARTVDYSFGHSVAFAFPILAARDSSEREVVVDLSPFLLSDWADVGTTLQQAATQRKVTGNITLDDKRSSLQDLHLFPANLEAEVRLTFQSPRNLGLETVSDYRSIPIGVHYSLLALPDRPMRPRYADERVGYFISAFKDFSRDTAESFFVRYVNRWRLEKQTPGAALSDPVRPITYYIDHTVPLEWRPYVRAGILEWNRAFEEAGYRGAIRVLDAPEDPGYSASDARFSTVRWTATNRSVYAVGPTNVDPRTGEILNADILISASWIQTWRGESREYVSPIASVQSAFAPDSAGDERLAALPLRRRAGARGERCEDAARGPRRDSGRRDGAPRLHRTGAEGAGDARGGAHPRPAAQLPGLGRHRGRRAVGPRAHRAARTRRVGHGLHAAGAGARSAAPGPLLLPDDRQLRPLGRHLRLLRARPRRGPRRQGSHR